MNLRSNILLEIFDSGEIKNINSINDKEVYDKKSVLINEVDFVNLIQTINTEFDKNFYKIIVNANNNNYTSSNDDLCIKDIFTKWANDTFKYIKVWIKSFIKYLDRIDNFNLEDIILKVKNIPDEQKECFKISFKVPRDISALSSLKKYTDDIDCDASSINDINKMIKDEYNKLARILYKGETDILDNIDFSNINDIINTVVGNKDKVFIDKEFDYNTFLEFLYILYNNDCCVNKNDIINILDISKIDEFAKKILLDINNLSKNIPGEILVEYRDYIIHIQGYYKLLMFISQMAGLCIDNIITNLSVVNHYIDNEFKISIDFIKGVKDNNLYKVRNILLQYIYDNYIDKFEVAEKYASEKISIYEDHNGTILKQDHRWWDNEYLNSLKNDILFNFSKERLFHLKDVFTTLLNNNMIEAGSIHGEPFDSKTLFDNEDLRDFNPSEWLDLSLTTECYELLYENNGFNERVCIKEALILTDNGDMKIKRLNLMREAEQSEYLNKINDIISRIKEIVTRFFSKLSQYNKYRIGFINRNREIIDKNPIKIESCESKGDIIAGMYRLQSNIEIAAFTNELLNDIKDKNEYFSKYVLGKLKEPSQFAKRRIEFNNNIVNYCKAYFGAGMNEKDGYPACKFNTRELEVNKNNIVNFVLKSNDFLKNINSDIDKLNNEAKKSVNLNNQQNNQNATNQTNNTNESYYSILYGGFITEADIEVQKTPDNDKENNNTKNDYGYKIYIDCYKDVLMSKLTAAEFVITELFQIINAHARSYMSKQQADNETNIYNNTKPNNN